MSGRSMESSRGLAGERLSRLAGPPSRAAEPSRRRGGRRREVTREGREASSTPAARCPHRWSLAGASTAGAGRKLGPRVARRARKAVRGADPVWPAAGGGLE